MPWVPSQGVEAVGEAVAGYASMPLEAVAAVAPLRRGVGVGVRVVEPQVRRGVVQAPLARGCGARRGGPPALDHPLLGAALGGDLGEDLGDGLLLFGVERPDPAPLDEACGDGRWRK